MTTKFNEPSMDMSLVPNPFSFLKYKRNKDKKQETHDFEYFIEKKRGKEEVYTYLKRVAKSLDVDIYDVMRKKDSLKKGSSIPGTKTSAAKKKSLFPIKRK